MSCVSFFYFGYGVNFPEHDLIESEPGCYSYHRFGEGGRESGELHKGCEGPPDRDGSQQYGSGEEKRCF